ncbi:hypothetical protein OC842_006797 [Tilletia horrida]|uniref:Uncharacterized protein n=1 Tax=Tilletia horrida TaxID=155126 RepID=A0AAN6JHL5_9BASI|nr:hypothetical protein OC842_006797 [Tilletia horrida]
MHRARAKVAVVVKTSGRKSVPPSDSAASAAATHASVKSGTGSGPTSSSATSSVPDSSAFVKRVAMRRATGPKATRSSPQKASAVGPSGALGEDVGDAASDDDDQPADRGDTPARAVSPVRSTRSSQAEADVSGADRNGEDLPSPRARGRPAFNGGQLYLPGVSSASSSQRPGRKRVRSSYSSGDEEELTEHEEHDKYEVSTSSPLLSMDHAEHTRVMLGLTLAIKSPEETILSLDSPLLNHALKEARSANAQHAQSPLSSSSSSDNDEDNDEDENDHEPALALFGTSAFVQANVGAAPPTTVGQVLTLETLAIPTLKRARMATGHDECLAQTHEFYTAITGVRLDPSVPYTQEEAEDSYIVWRNEENQRNYKEKKATEPEKALTPPKTLDKMKPGCKVPIWHFLRDAEGNIADSKKINWLREFVRARKQTLLDLHRCKKAEEAKERSEKLLLAKGRTPSAKQCLVSAKYLHVMVTVAGEQIPITVYDALKRDAAVAYPQLGYCNSDWKVSEILVRMTKSERYYRRVKSEPTDAEQTDDESMEVDNDEDNPSAPVSTRLAYTPSRAEVTHTSGSASEKRPVAARTSKKDASRYNALRVVHSPGKM